MMRGLSGSPYPPTAYYGLSVGLPEVYRQLCTRYDDIRQAAPDFNQKLLAEIFLQLVGTRVLHPFWDGNGRTFMAHLVLFLERNGVVIRDYADARRMTQALTDINDRFLRQILTDAKLGLVRGNFHIMMRINPQMRQDYMVKLRSAIERAIDSGIEETGPYFSYFSEAVLAIKTYLIKQKLLGPNADFYRQVEDNAGKINRVPEPYRHYFLSKFKDYYLQDEEAAISFKDYMSLLLSQEVDERVFGALQRVMQVYEGSEFNWRVGWRMASEFHYTYLHTYLRYGKERAFQLANEFCTSAVQETIALWAQTSNVDT